MLINYIRVYHMDMDCNTHEIICSPLPPNLDAVRKSIGFQNNCGTIVPPGIHYYKATDLIQIDGDFTVPLGTQLTLETMPCYIDY